ncbi:FAD:protein FMN transferase [Clostridium thermarum]|uniref:FAD:protein FMN transferase n=1 Tax=Clostridium thermarum TaxID=1716543 RepID=UPI0013D5B688|nr:FAD:protein FMN transferase [Clostridium thermarum]
MKRKMAYIMICIVLIMSFTGCAKKDELVSDTALMMDTVIQIKAYGPKAEKAIKTAFKRIEEIEKLASATIDTSDISKINQAAGKDYVKVHPDIVKMIKTAVHYSELSDGAFDITVGPLIKLWNIGSGGDKVPLEADIEALMPLVGYKNIRINEEESSVKLMQEGMSIDLGGIAKGFAADEIIKIFNDMGVDRALIVLGGSSIYAIGEKPENKSWTVQIQHPRKGRNESYLGIISLKDQALTTSGDYERYFIVGDKRYHHILNPYTGYPTDNGIMSVSINVDSSIPDCNMIADILTKTVFVSGIEKGFEFIDGIKGVSAMAVTTDYEIYKSSRWDKELRNLNTEFKVVN